MHSCRLGRVEDVANGRLFVRVCAQAELQAEKLEVEYNKKKLAVERSMQEYTSNVDTEMAREKERGMNEMEQLQAYRTATDAKVGTRTGAACRHTKTDAGICVSARSSNWSRLCAPCNARYVFSEFGQQGIHGVTLLAHASPHRLPN